MTDQKREQYVTPNPVEITKLRKMKTLHDKPYIGMFSGALPHPVISLAPFQYHLLSGVGIDPNKITDEETYCSLTVYWEETGKKKESGKPYIGATRIEGNAHDPVLDELKTIKFLLTVLAEQAVGGYDALMEIWRERYTPAKPAQEPPEPQQKPAPPQDNGDAVNVVKPKPSKKKGTALKGPSPAIRVGDTVSAQGKTKKKKGTVTAVVAGKSISVEFADGKIYDFAPDKIELVDF